MNPIAVSGLISIGKSLLDNTLLKPNGIHSKPDGDAFKTMLEQAGGTKNDGVSSILSQYGVHSLSDMRQLRADLQRQLLDDPALAKVRVENPGASIHLVKTPDGSYQATLSNGKNISFAPGSETAQTAAALHQLSTFLGEGISTDHPGAITLAA